MRRCNGERGGRMQIASFCRFFLYIKLDPHIGSPSWLDVVAVGGLATWGSESSISAGTMASWSLPHSFRDHDSMVPSRLANVVAYFHNSASCPRLQSFMDHVVYVGYLDCIPWPVQHAELIWQYSSSKHRLSHAIRTIHP